MTNDRKWLLGGLAVVLVLVNALVAHKEHVLRHGRELYLEIAPRDPRSLMQGDYMALDYRVARDASVFVTETHEGRLVVTVDADHVAHYARLEGEAPLKPGEQLIRYHRRDWLTDIGADAYYFEEGTGAVYAQARYAKVMATESGEIVLAALCDVDRKPIRPSP